MGSRDRRKLTFYFIAEKRIDFRELVRELFRCVFFSLCLCLCFCLLVMHAFTRSLADDLSTGCIKQGSGWPLYKGQEGTSSNCSPPSIQVPTEEEDSSRTETHSKNANHKPRKLSRSHDANQCYEMYVCMYDLDMQYPRSSSHI